MNQAQAKIRRLYDDALNVKPSILIIEDIDSIVNKESSGNKDSERKVIFQFSHSLELVKNVE